MTGMSKQLGACGDSRLSLIRYSYASVSLGETTDERPLRVAAIQRLSTAYLRTALDPSDASWGTLVG